MAMYNAYTVLARMGGWHIGVLLDVMTTCMSQLAILSIPALGNIQ